MIETKVVIIGAGAAGLSAAIYLARANMPFVILEKSAPGGKLINIAKIENYPGLPEMSGFDMAMSFIDSASKFGINPIVADVSSVIKQDDKFHVYTSNNEEYVCSVVIVATGLSNIPTIKGEKERLHRGVSYCATCDGPLYRGKDIALYGEGDRALEEAIYLMGQAKHLYVLTPDKEYQGNEALLKVLESAENVSIIKDSKVIEIFGDNKVEGIKYEKEGKEYSLEVSAFFPFVGERSASSFLSSLDIEMEKGFIIVNEEMESSCKGIYAAGDIVFKKLRQVVTAASDGAIAATSSVNSIRRKR